MPLKRVNHVRWATKAEIQTIRALDLVKLERQEAIKIALDPKLIKEISSRIEKAQWLVEEAVKTMTKFPSETVH